MLRKKGMDWEEQGGVGWRWTGEIEHREAKEKLAQRIARRVRSGEVVGVGSGSTVYIALQYLAERVRREQLEIRVITASQEMSMACVHLGLQQVSLWEKRPDWSFDGADEIDPQCNLIKGRGGALFKEKLLICSSPSVYILADESKFVSRLGEHFPVPVEVFPWALSYVMRQLSKTGAIDIVLRPAGGKDGPVITENGNLLLDVRFKEIDPQLEKRLKAIPGVIESGLFIGYPVKIVS